MTKGNRDWLDLAKKIPGWLTGLIALITALVGFVKLWQGDAGLVTVVLLVVGIGGGTLGCACVAFKRGPKPLVGHLSRALPLTGVTGYAICGSKCSNTGKTSTFRGNSTRSKRLFPCQMTTSAFLGRGFAYVQKGEDDKAIADFNRFLELNDDPYWQQQAEEQLQMLQE